MAIRRFGQVVRSPVSSVHATRAPASRLPGAHSSSRGGVARSPVAPSLHGFMGGRSGASGSQCDAAHGGDQFGDCAGQVSIPAHGSHELLPGSVPTYESPAVDDGYVDPAYPNGGAPNAGSPAYGDLQEYQDSPVYDEGLGDYYGAVGSMGGARYSDPMLPSDYYAAEEEFVIAEEEEVPSLLDESSSAADVAFDFAEEVSPLLTSDVDVERLD